MTPELFTTIELIAVLSLYCAAFCPILCWVIARDGNHQTP